MRFQLIILAIVATLVCALTGCKFSESSDGKRIIALGEKVAVDVAESELEQLANQK